MPTFLFAYGTLMPNGPEAAAQGGWSADGVRGRLFDLGPYPALVDCAVPDAGWVEGYVRPVTPDELTDKLDPYEGVDEGWYRRIETTTRTGLRVWVYEYAQPLPANARGPLTRWERPEGAPRPSPPHRAHGLPTAPLPPQLSREGEPHPMSD